MVETRTVTLAEFLLARIAEAGAGPWLHYEADGVYHSCPATRDPEMAGDLEVGEEFCDCGMPHQRAHVLAKCDAERRIVERATALAEWDEMGSSTREDGEFILRALALPYVAHPDFREEWRP